jgi:hypothetical protein
MILNKAVSMAIVASPLAVVGINMDVPSFTAGMMLALPAYYFGREVWREQSQIGFWMGMGMAAFGALVAAMAPELIPVNAPTQFKMVGVAFGITMIVAWLRKRGQKWSNGDDKNS